VERLLAHIKPKQVSCSKHRDYTECPKEMPGRYETAVTEHQYNPGTIMHQNVCVCNNSNTTTQFRFCCIRAYTYLISLLHNGYRVFLGVKR